VFRRRAARGSARMARFESSAFDRPARVYPAAKSFRHRSDVLVSHLLQRISSKRRAIPARAVDDDLLFAWDRGLYSTLEISAGNEQRTRYPAEVPFVGLANVEE